MPQKQPVNQKPYVIAAPDGAACRLVLVVYARAGSTSAVFALDTLDVAIGSGADGRPEQAGRSAEKVFPFAVVHEFIGQRFHNRHVRLGFLE